MIDGTLTRNSEGTYLVAFDRVVKRPIAKVWADRKSLSGKQVTVRGKVVKYNGNVMGLNWIHLQDGSGKEAEHTNDITVTSDAEAKIGETITATGVVGINKDLGSGYNYPVIVEKATIAR